MHATSSLSRGLTSLLQMEKTANAPETAHMAQDSGASGLEGGEAAEPTTLNGDNAQVRIGWLFCC